MWLSATTSISSDIEGLRGGPRIPGAGADARNDRVAECRVLPAPYRVPQAAHQRLVEVDVVQREQARGQTLACAEQVPEIGAGPGAACDAFALGIERPGVALVLESLDVQRALPGEELPVARVARRHHAVEEIDAGAGEC